MAKVGQWSVLRDLTCKSRNIAVKIRIIRAYRVPSFGTRGETLEILFHDQEGTRMHTQIPRHLIPKYEPLIEEEKLYKMRNVIVLKNYQQYRTCSHNYILQIFSDTLMQKINTIGFPMVMYDLRSFEQLHSDQNIDERILIDVVGRVVSCSEEKTRPYQGEQVKLMDVTLEDNEGFQLECTLWGEYAQQMINYLGLMLNEPLILLIQLGRLRRNKGFVSVSTAFHATKLIFNGGSDTIANFKKKLMTKSGNDFMPSPISLTPAGSSQSQDIRNGTMEVISIEDLKAKTEPGKFWILGTVFSIENYKNWCYLGCATCNCKVVPDDTGFKCTGCKQITTRSNYRYHIDVQILDGTDYASFTMWDKECTQLLGRTTMVMRDMMAERNGDPETFPREEIESMVKTKGLFQVSVKGKDSESTYNGKRSFGIMKMITDPGIWQRYDLNNEGDFDMDFWDEPEIELSLEEIGSNNPPVESNITGQKRKMTLGIDEDDITMRNLENELEAAKKPNGGKAIKKEK